MPPETRYRYEQRIKELEREVEMLRDYRRVALDIFNTTTDLIGEQKQISQAWILKQFRQLMR